MPIAALVLPDGTKVTIEGKTHEVAAVIKKISSSPGGASVQKKSGTKSTPTSKAKTQPKGPIGHVAALRDEGYFKARRTLADIQQKLEERGHIYAQTSLSPALVRLTRKRELRRLKTNKGWVYVA